MSEHVDAGHGVTFGVRSIDGDPRGVAYYHPHPTKGPPFVCSGYAPLKPGTADGWDLVQLEPLTISPSLLCRACGHHGFLRDGKWVPA